MSQDIRNLGTFADIAELWAAHPEGGREGDYATVAGTRYRWNKYERIWENGATVTQSTGRKNHLVEGDQEVTHDLTVLGTLRAKNVKQPHMGMYESAAALSAAIPSPEVGMYALVGNELPARLFVCNTAGTWTDTGNDYDGEDVDLTQYVLGSVFQSYADRGYKIIGKAVPETNPSSPTKGDAYLATTAGTYTNFGGTTITDGKLAIFKYNGSSWSVESVAVGKDYDGYFGITNGPALSPSGTQSAYIDDNGNIVPQSHFTTKSFAVSPGKSYYVSGLENGNSGTCGWAAYSGATKLTYGANNISTNDAISRVPEGTTTLYVCQPNFGNLPAIEVRETDSIIEEILSQLNREETTEAGPDLDIANYALLVETYVNKIWNNGQLIDDALTVRNATSLVKIDKTKPIIPGTEVYADVVFFDAYENYISTVQAYIWEPIAAADIPATAVFMAFNYYRGNSSADDGEFYVSTRPDCTRLTKKLYATQNKVKGTRPKVQIYTTDTQETIFKKLVDAIYIEDCDVVFEKGAYTLNSIFYLMRSKYEWADAFELPVGGNCHYYLNNSTITGNYAGQSPSSGLVVETNSSIFGTHRLDGQTFRIMDGELIAEGLIYCVHDEASGGAGSYVHHYENMIMRYNTGQYTQSLSKCIGGGTGLAGEVVLNGCKFFNAHTTEDVSWHGHNLSTTSVFKLFIANSFFVNGIGLHQLAANETGYLFLSASLVPAVPSGVGWEVFSILSGGAA